MLSSLTSFIQSFSVSGTLALVVARSVLCVFVLFLAVAAFYLTRKALLSLVHVVISKTRNNWDDILIQERVFDRLSHIVPVIVVQLGSRLCFSDIPIALTWMNKLVHSYVVLVCLLVAYALLNSLHSVYERFQLARSRPIKSYLQVVKIVLAVISIILVVSSIIDKSPVVLLSGLGAMTAILLLVFRDSILGFVASIQIAANDMVREGDWVEVPKYGADGDVIDISLTTIKVQNWDKTITSIPSYAFVQDSFKNWRGMTESGGRRIKRSIEIDMHSVHFCSAELLDKLARISLLKDYLEKKRKEILEYNQSQGVVDSLINGRRLTNLGTLRAYIYAYLKSHPDIHQNMTLIVRQLPPSESGIPLEIYCFSKIQDWSEFERIQADIFDHILSIIDEFELSVYQQPSGHDFATIAASNSK